MASPTIAPLHAAYLAQLAGALFGLLREANQDDEPNDMPDGISVSYDGSSIEVEYTRGGIPVAGESL